MLKSGCILRGLLMFFAIVLVVLGVVFPSTEENAAKWNDDGLKTDSLIPGDVIVQPLNVTESFNKVGVRVEVVREAKGLTLELALTKDEKMVAQESFSLQKVKAKGRVILKFPTVQAGDYVLTIVVKGEGNTKLGAGESHGMLLNGENQALGCALWINHASTQYSKAIFFCAALLLLLAVVPAGAKEGKRHV